MLRSRWTVFALAAFAVSRVLYWLAGVRFDASPVERYWQFIDPVLMREDLFRSLFYLHMQPPGFNLFVGGIVKLFPGGYADVLQAIYLAAGVLIALSLLRLMESLGVNPPTAATLTALFMISPGCVLYENIAIYEYPVLLLLIWAALGLRRFWVEPHWRWSVAFFGCMLGLVMIRNQFHLVFLAAIAGVLLFFRRRRWKAVLAGAGPALGITLALYLKNWVLFGAFTGSTWMGMATGVTTTYHLTPAEADRLIAQGVVSPLAKITPFSDLDAYQGLIQMPPPTGVPVLDQKAVSTGHPNYNHLAYLELHDRYLRDSLAVMRHYPAAYLRSEAIAWFAYFLPASDLHSFDRARAVIEPFDRFFSAVFHGQFRRAATRKELRQIRAEQGVLPLVSYTGVFLMALSPTLFLWGSAQAGLRMFRARLKPEQAALLAFLLFTIAFVTLVSNTLSSFENNRYRFPVDGFYLALLGMLLSSAKALRGGAKGVSCESDAAERAEPTGVAPGSQGRPLPLPQHHVQRTGVGPR